MTGTDSLNQGTMRRYLTFVICVLAATLAAALAAGIAVGWHHDFFGRIAEAQGAGARLWPALFRFFQEAMGFAWLPAMVLMALALAIGRFTGRYWPVVMPVAGAVTGLLGRARFEAHVLAPPELVAIGGAAGALVGYALARLAVSAIARRFPEEDASCI